MFESRRRRGSSSNSEYADQYLTIEALEDGNIMIDASGDGTFPITVFYSINDGEWIGFTEIYDFSVSAGDKVRMYSKRTSTGVRIETQMQCNVYGNIMSMIHGQDFKSNNRLFNGCFEYLFNNSLIVDASNLVLPATILTDYCYYCMFYECWILVSAPELPATILADGCYASMFDSCSLTTAPVLPATTLADSCYYQMFAYCSSLNHITMLATDISASNCLDNWVYDVASTGTFVKHPDMTSLPTGRSGIPSGWTVVNASV